MTLEIKSRSQQGSILLLALLLLATISVILTNITTRTSQHSRLIRNYQQHFASIKQAESCQNNILKTFSGLADVRTWSKNGSLSRSGLYNQTGRSPFNVKLFEWDNGSGTMTRHCRYIIEFLGTIKPGEPGNPSNSRHVLRISVRFKSDLNTRLIIQSIISVDDKQKNSVIKFRSPLKQQQWTLIQW